MNVAEIDKSIWKVYYDRCTVNIVEKEFQYVLDMERVKYAVL
jgi:hypothetical protein